MTGGNVNSSSSQCRGSGCNCSPRGNIRRTVRSSWVYVSILKKVWLCGSCRVQLASFFSPSARHTRKFIVIRFSLWVLPPKYQEISSHYRCIFSAQEEINYSNNIADPTSWIVLNGHHKFFLYIYRPSYSAWFHFAFSALVLGFRSWVIMGTYLEEMGRMCKK